MHMDVDIYDIDYIFKKKKKKLTWLARRSVTQSYVGGAFAKGRSTGHFIKSAQHHCVYISNSKQLLPPLSQTCSGTGDVPSPISVQDRLE